MASCTLNMETILCTFNKCKSGYTTELFKFLKNTKTLVAITLKNLNDFKISQILH